MSAPVQATGAPSPTAELWVLFGKPPASAVTALGCLWERNALYCEGGIGEEYLDFSFGGMRRISFLAMKIPSLPHGPLSVSPA